jgi:hypothetical protein
LWKIFRAELIRAPHPFTRRLSELSLVRKYDAPVGVHVPVNRVGANVSII